MAEDLRVICLDLSKVYTNIQSASYATMTSKKEVLQCCEGWRRYSRDMHTFMYYDRYCEKVPVEKRVQDEKRDLVEVHLDLSEIEAIHRKRATIKDYYAMVKIVYKAITAFLDDTHSWGKILSTYELTDAFVPFVRRFSPEYHIEARSFSHHFTAYFATYKRIMGLELYDVWSIKSRKYILGFKFTKVPGIDIYDIDHFFLLDAFKMNHGHTRPVIDLSTGKIYTSIHRASKLTGIATNVILWNCNNDFDTVFKRSGEEYKFRFAKIVPSS